MNLYNYQKSKEDGILQVMEQVYSPKYGLANMIFLKGYGKVKVKCQSHSYVLGNVIPMYRTSVENTEKSQLRGSGTSLNEMKSKIKAYGEFIERFCATNIYGDHDKKIIYDTYQNLNRNCECLDINDLVDFEEVIYENPKRPVAKYTDDSILSWVKGKNLITGNDVWIPAQKAFVGIELLNDELPYIPWISTGLACGSNYVNALISGIYEVVERDSFMLTWQLKLHGKRIIVDKITDPELNLLYNHIVSHITGSDRLNIYDISKTEGIYTILTFIRNDNPNSFGLITSAASDVNPQRALLKSLEELCLTQGCAYEKLIEDRNAGCKAIEKSEVNTLYKHMLFYSTGQRSCEFDFIEKPDCFIKLSEMNCYINQSNDNVLAYIINLFKRDNKRVYSVDVTRQEIKSCGLSVIRAIIVGYNDLEFSHNLRLTNNKRLKYFQQKYNCSINDAPHPFP